MTDVSEAVSVLRLGRLVAFPTETVYGLGADATNPDAVARIFAAKGRPANNPLIVHVADTSVAKRYALTWPEKAELLADAFWPGPLTLVLPKAKSVATAATAGGMTVGLRVPNHPLAFELLRAFDGPVAAPSANKSNGVSPTTAEHVREELGSAVDLILDGGPCAVGIESTVLDLTGDVPRILRPGGLSRERLEAVIGPVVENTSVAAHAAPLISPGQLPVHYAPRKPCYRFNAVDLETVIGRGMRIGVLAIGEGFADAGPTTILALPKDPDAYARRLYAALRELDAADVTAIHVQMPPDEARWRAVRDRLLRATRPIV